MTNDFEKDSYDIIYSFYIPNRKKQKSVRWRRCGAILPGVYHYLPKIERRGKLPRKEDPYALNFCDKAFVPDDKAYGITTCHCIFLRWIGLVVRCV
jgi:hypothetical protein